jgi:hypothetical protein
VILALVNVREDQHDGVVSPGVDARFQPWRAA